MAGLNARGIFFGLVAFTLTLASGEFDAAAQQRTEPSSDVLSETHMSDLESLLSLNKDYVDAVQNSDVARFDEILAEDFRCSNPDGSIVDRAGFLEQTRRPVTITNLQAHDVEVRIMGDVAIIHASTSYNLLDGSLSGGRYTDVWVREDGRWLAVSAHVGRGS